MKLNWKEILKLLITILTAIAGTPRCSLVPLTAMSAMKASEDALLNEAKASAVANDAKPKADISSLNLC